MRLSSAAKRSSSGGEIVNLMSVDAQKMQEFPTFLHYLWIAPIQVSLATYFLWQKIGIAALAGLSFLVIVIPCNAIFLGAKMRKYQVINNSFIQQ